MKYRPDYPQRFGSLQDARMWARPFVEWYNHEHRHTGLALMTPATVHTGLASQVTAQRQLVLQAAYAQHPARFVKGPPVLTQLPDAVWINPPAIPTAQVTPDTPPYSAITSPPSGAQVESRVGAVSRLAQPLTPTSTGPQLASAGEEASTQQPLQ